MGDKTPMLEYAVELSPQSPEQNTVLIPRPVIRFLAQLLVGVLMSAQLAVAAYACTGGMGVSLKGAGRSGNDMGLAAAMMPGLIDQDSGHAVMDPAQPSLCAGHCQSGQQNAEARSVLNLPAAVPVSLYPQVLTILRAEFENSSTVQNAPPHLADPPHGILHCCFRI